MSKSPLDTAKDVMSGKVTKDRIVRAEQAGVRAIPNRPKAKPKVKNLIKPKKKFVDARQAKIAAATAADEAAIKARGLRRR